MPPAVRSSGPRSPRFVSTFAGESGVKFATAASNSGFPGDGIAQRSYSCCDSSAETAFPNP